MWADEGCGARLLNYIGSIVKKNVWTKYFLNEAQYDLVCCELQRACEHRVNLRPVMKSAEKLFGVPQLVYMESDVLFGQHRQGCIEPLVVIDRCCLTDTAVHEDVPPRASVVTLTVEAWVVRHKLRSILPTRIEKDGQNI
jgi:hypothetical protein